MPYRCKKCGYLSWSCYSRKKVGVERVEATKQGLCLDCYRKEIDVAEGILMEENCVEYPIKEFLPSKKAQRNYHKFLKDLNKIQKENHTKKG